MLSIFGSNESKLKPNFLGVKWDTTTGKILAKSENWDTLPENSQWEAISLPPWEFFDFQNQKFIKHLVPNGNPNYEEFYLLPADEWYNTIQKLEATALELQQTKEQLMAFVQKMPIPLLIYNLDKSQKILFANPLLLQLNNIPLSKLYQGMSLNDVFGNQTELVLKAGTDCKNLQQTVQVNVEIRTSDGNIKFWVVSNFYFKTSFMEGVIVGILDITHEKEQEYKLHEAYQELQAQAEELSQSHEALTLINQELNKSYEIIQQKNTDLEESLKSARRFQRKILINHNEFNYLKNFLDCEIQILPFSVIGGDFFFIEQNQPLQDDWIFFIFGDATGHGPSGTLLALTVRLILKSYLNTIQNIEELHLVLENAHQEILNIFEADNQKVCVEGAEVIILALPKKPMENKKFYFTSAGLPLYFYQNLTNQLNLFQPKTKSLGWFVEGAEPSNFQTYSVHFSSKDSIFLFTDGFQDQLNPDLKKLGKKRLFQFLQQIPPHNHAKAKVDFIHQFWLDWKKDSSQTDDILFTCFQFH